MEGGGGDGGVGKGCELHRDGDDVGEDCAQDVELGVESGVDSDALDEAGAAVVAEEDDGVWGW